LLQDGYVGVGVLNLAKLSPEKKAELLKKLKAALRIAD